MKTLFYSIALIFAMMACSKDEPAINANDNSGDATLRCTLIGETAFAYFIPNCESTGTGYVFNSAAKFTKGNPNGHENLGINNNWGWAINYKTSQTTEQRFSIYAGAGQNELKKGTWVGYLYITCTPVSGNDYIVKFNTVLENAHLMSEMHIYVSDDTPVTNAPGQFGNTFNFPGGVTSFETTIPVTDNGDGKIWIIVHYGV